MVDFRPRALSGAFFLPGLCPMTPDHVAAFASIRLRYPCRPTSADRPPTGPNWIYEIKHDGFRLMARRDSVGIRLLTRNGHNWAARYPLVFQAVDALTVRSCLIDGEAVVVDDTGLTVFERLRQRRHDHVVFLFAFDLLELNGADLRREPIEVRKATLASILRKSRPGVRLNEHLEYPDGDVVFRHACKLGCEGIVSKRLGSRYRSGQSSRLAEVQEPERTGRQTRSRRRLGQVAMTMTGKNRIMIYGPKDDGTYVVEFRTAEGDTLAISIPRSETSVIRYFQERVPYGLFVPDTDDRS